MTAKKKLSHILYVDDDPDSRLLVQVTLQNTGRMKVTLCTTGAEILESAVNDPPQMIILDVMMRGMDGPAILKEIKKDSRISNIPVVFLTAKTDEQAHRELVGMGAIGVITKPFDLVDIEKQLNSLWEGTNV